jgi:hypothetical protein
MPRAMHAFVVTVLLAAVALTPALADDDSPAAAPVVVAPAAQTPMLAAINAVLQEERALVAELATRLTTATDDEAALTLHRAIEQAKADAELRILGIQADHARREGRLEAAVELEAAIAAFGKVEAAPVVEQRSAPSTDGNGR